MNLQDMTYEQAGSIAIATFNRPHQLNAFREETFEDILAILKRVASDPAITCVVLAGKGRAFSAGEDLRSLWDMLEAGPTSARSLAHLDRLQDITRSLVSLQVPVIAAVNGVAVGAGLELTIAADIRIASRSASFSFPEARHGLFETNGVMFFLSRIVGYGRAVEWMLTGRTVTVEEAYAAGLVTHVTEPQALLPQALEVARLITANAPISVRLIKKTAREALTLELEAVLAREVEGVMQCLGSADLKEGVRAFLEKRVPAYRGA